MHLYKNDKTNKNVLYVWYTYQCFSMFCQQVAAPHPEEELDRLTKKLVYDMNHPPTEEYFGMFQYFIFPDVLLLILCVTMTVMDLSLSNFLCQVDVLGVEIMFWEMAVAVSLWSRCFMWSVSPVSPVMPV